jgi:hypothetical protein
LPTPLKNLVAGADHRIKPVFEYLPASPVEEQAAEDHVYYGGKAEAKKIWRA